MVQKREQADKKNGRNAKFSFDRPHHPEFLPRPKNEVKVAKRRPSIV
jgi:hypothetical protein